MRTRRFAAALAGIGITLTVSILADEQKQSEAARPAFMADGSVQVPAFTLPPSDLMSAEGVAQLRQRSAMQASASPTSSDIATARQQVEARMAPRVASMREQFAVTIESRTLANIPVRVLTPQAQPVEPDRVLINLHGGAFSLCADACGLLESLPIAALGGYRVITIDYRMAPEAKHPAAVEDTVAVYKDLLKSYKPEHIGIFGCSAGGALTAQTAASLALNGLPPRQAPLGSSARGRRDSEAATRLIWPATSTAHSHPHRPQARPDPT